MRMNRKQRKAIRDAEIVHYVETSPENPKGIMKSCTRAEFAAWAQEPDTKRVHKGDDKGPTEQ